MAYYNSTEIDNGDDDVIILKVNFEWANIGGNILVFLAITNAPVDGLKKGNKKKKRNIFVFLYGYRSQTVKGKSISHSSQIMFRVCFSEDFSHIICIRYTMNDSMHTIHINLCEWGEGFFYLLSENFVFFSFYIFVLHAKLWSIVWFVVSVM